MELIKFDAAHSGVNITAGMQAAAAEANSLLHSGKGAGNDFLGWVNLPSSITSEELADIKRVAANLRSKAEVVICKRPELYTHETKNTVEALRL